MSKYMNSKYQSLVPYTPGEQPQNRKYIKLNTNESPYPPSEGVLDAVNREAARDLRLYSDPTAAPLKAALAEQYGVLPENVFVANGSDDILNFAFMLFGEDGMAFADITYGFYKVIASLNQLKVDIKPLMEDYSLNPDDYKGIGKACAIANPNAPTGMTIPLSEIEAIVLSNPDHVVIIDEAYVDFGGETAVPLTKKYENLLVVHTYSKSRSMAGARVGYAIGSKALIGDLETLKFSTNPYNVNRISMAAAVAAVKDAGYYKENCRKIMETRAATAKGLEEMGFRVLPSCANFIYASHPSYDGKKLYEDLKEQGILIRHLTGPRMDDFNRITIGTPEQMETFLGETRKLLMSAK